MFQYYYTLRERWSRFTWFFERRSYAIAVVVGVLFVFGWVIRALVRH